MKIFMILTFASILVAQAVPPLNIITGILAFLTVVVGIATALSRLRFSLRTMIGVMLWGGTCGTLLTKVQEPALFAAGIFATLLLVAFIIASVARANIPTERLDK